MFFIIKILFFIVVKIYGFILKLFRDNNFTIKKIGLEYKFDESKYECENDLSVFWKNELKNTTDGGHWTDVTRFINKMGETPECVSDMLFRVKYTFEGKIFKMITRDENFEWPPVKSEGMKFRLPITAVLMVDGDDKPIKDVTKKYKMLEGPYGDFCNQTEVTIEDLFMFVEYEKLKIMYATGQSKLVPKTSSVRSLL